MKAKIREKRELIFCPKCGALSYGYTLTMLSSATPGPVFCRSCDCNLTEAAKAFAEAFRNIQNTVKEIKQEGEKTIETITTESESATTLTVETK